jgi:hypothetical protein
MDECLISRKPSSKKRRRNYALAEDREEPSTTRRRPPSLSELLAAPTIRPMMESDRVTPEEVRRLFEGITRSMRLVRDQTEQVCSPEAQGFWRAKWSRSGSCALFVVQGEQTFLPFGSRSNVHHASLQAKGRCTSPAAAATNECARSELLELARAQDEKTDVLRHHANRIAEALPDRFPAPGPIETRPIRKS